MRFAPRVEYASPQESGGENFRPAAPAFPHANDAITQVVMKLLGEDIQKP